MFCTKKYLIRITCLIVKKSKKSKHVYHILSDILYSKQRMNVTHCIRTFDIDHARFLIKTKSVSLMINIQCGF